MSKFFHIFFHLFYRLFSGSILFCNLLQHFICDSLKKRGFHYFDCISITFSNTDCFAHIFQYLSVRDSMPPYYIGNRISSETLVFVHDFRQQFLHVVRIIHGIRCSCRQPLRITLLMILRIKD